MTVGVVGLGNMGTAMANLIASNGHRVIGWEYHARIVDEINRDHVNSRFLPGVMLHVNLTATPSLHDIVPTCDVVFIAVPSSYLRATLEPVIDQLQGEVVLVNLAKGIEQQTGLTAFQMLTRLFPRQRRIMMGGPAIANEFSRGMPTVVVLAGTGDPELRRVSSLLETTYFRTRYSDDEIGVELGGILKNVYAIGLGMLDEKGVTSRDFWSVYLTLALEEMAHIGVRLGAKRDTFFSLAGMGDLLATSLSAHSHNRTLGELIAKGFTVEAIGRQMGVLPEGYHTMTTLRHLAEKHHMAIPLASGLWDVVEGRCDVEGFLDHCMRDIFAPRGGR